MLLQRQHGIQFPLHAAGRQATAGVLARGIGSYQRFFDINELAALRGKRQR
jgi:hypothetical protein